MCVFTRNNSASQLFHALSSEGWLVSNHFVQDAAQTPNIALVVVGHVFPDFGAGIVGGTGHSHEHTGLCDFADVHVTELGLATLGKEDVSTLYVSMTDLEVVEGLKSSDNLDEVVPDCPFAKVFFELLFMLNFIQNVATICMLKHNAQLISSVLEEGLLVADDVGMVDGRENADLVKRILLFLPGQFLHFDLFHSVNGAVILSSDLVDFREGSLA